MFSIRKSTPAEGKKESCLLSCRVVSKYERYLIGRKLLLCYI